MSLRHLWSNLHLFTFSGVPNLCSINFDNHLLLPFSFIRSNRFKSSTSQIVPNRKICREARSEEFKINMSRYHNFFCLRNRKFRKLKKRRRDRFFSASKEAFTVSRRLTKSTDVKRHNVRVSACACARECVCV